MTFQSEEKYVAKKRDFLKVMGLWSVALLAEPTLTWGQTS